MAGRPAPRHLDVHVQEKPAGGHTMSSRTALVTALAFLMATAAALAASAQALPSGRPVPLDQNVVQYFASNGVDPQYLGEAPSKIPADVLAKMTTLESDRAFSSLLLSDLRVDAAVMGDSLFVDLGPRVFQYSRGANGTGESFSSQAVS
jgi:hypothetical protein